MNVDLAGIVDVLPDLVWTALPDGRAEFINRRWSEYTGMRLQEALGAGWLSAVHPDDLAHILERWGAFVASGEAGEAEARLRRFDGEYRWFLFRADPIRDERGIIVRWCGTNTDIEDRKQAETQLAAENRLLEMIASGRAVRDVLEAVCRFVEEISPDCLCGAYPIDWSGPVFQYGVAPSLPASYVDPIEGWPVRADVAPCGTTALDNTQMIVADIEADPIWRGTSYRDHVAAHGLRSVWSTPICSLDGRVSGTFCIYQRKPATPSPRHQELISHATRIASIALDRARTDQALLAREGDLRRAYDFLNHAQRLSKTGSYTWDQHPEKAIWSDEIYRILGLEPGTRVDVEMARAMIYPDDLPAYDAMVAQGLANEDMNARYRIVTPSGAVKHVHAVSRRLEEIIDRAVWIGATQDVTESTLAKEALEAREADLRRANNYLTIAQRLSKTGSFTWDVRARESRWSEEMYRIFELAPDTADVSSEVPKIVHPDDLPIVNSLLRQALRGESIDVEYRLITARGALKHVHTVAHCVEQTADRPVLVGALQDVTDRKVAEDGLDRARRELDHVARVTALSALTASIAHEVNQPLAGIVTNAGACLRMLASNPPNIEGAQATAQRTIRDANRAAEVIKRLRALFARRPLAAEPVDLNDAAREVLALSSSELQSARVIAHADFADGLPSVPGDRVQLQQVILNLVLNAAQAMRMVDGRPRELWISTGPHDESQIVMSVSDCGVGADVEHLEALFNPFYTTKPDGMGVGLSVSRSIVEAHGGRLWASANEGPGLTFSFCVPLVAPEALLASQSLE